MSAEPLISHDDLAVLRLSATALSLDERSNPALAETYRRTGVLYLSNILAEDLAGRLAKVWGRAEFKPSKAEGVGERLLESPGHAGAGLLLALRQPALFRWLEAITACGPISDVQGDVARHDASCPQGLGWHDDVADRQRRLAITINLDDQPYDGGVFEMRLRGQVEVITSHVHRRIGECMIFSVDPRYEHRLTPVTDSARTVFAGWFMGDGT